MFSRSAAGFRRTVATLQRTGLLALNRLPTPDCVPGLSRRSAALYRASPPPPPGDTRRARSPSGDRRMPKKQKVKLQPAGGAAAEEASGPVGRDRSGAVTIAVHVKPGSKHSGITGVSAEVVGVAVAAPPADGEANTELVRFLAEVLELKRSHVSLHKGSRSRDKLIRVDASLSPEDVLRRLREAAG